MRHRRAKKGPIHGLVDRVRHVELLATRTVELDRLFPDDIVPSYALVLSVSHAVKRSFTGRGRVRSFAERARTHSKRALLKFYAHLSEALLCEDVPLVDEAVQELGRLLDGRGVWAIVSVYVYCKRHRVHTFASERRVAYQTTRG